MGAASGSWRFISSPDEDESAADMGDLRAHAGSSYLLSRMILLSALLRLIEDMETEYLLLNMIFNFIYVIQVFQAHRTF